MPPRGRVRVLAFWAGEDYGAPFEYDLRGTPCDNVVGRDFCYYPRDVARLFPDDRWLADHGIESFAGVPLFDAADRPLGHMAVMDVAPMSDDMPAMSILKIFAARAGAEIERKLAEEALAQEKERAQVTLASIGDGVIRTDAAGIDRLPEPGRRAADRLDLRRGLRPARACRSSAWSTRPRGKPLPNPVERCLREGQVVELPGYSLLTRRDGREFAIRDSVAPIRDRGGRITGSVLVFKDVTQLRGMEREMIYLARHDPLTGLINRREFEKRLQHCLTTRPRRGAAARPVLPRPRRVQGGQRHLRPPRRRRDAQAGHRAAPVAAAQDRHPGPPGRRRVRRRSWRTPPWRTRAAWATACAWPSSASASPGRSGSSRSGSASAWCRSPARAWTWPRCSPPPTPPATWPRRAAATACTSTSRTTAPSPSATARCSGSTASTRPSPSTASSSTSRASSP